MSQILLTLPRWTRSMKYPLIKWPTAQDWAKLWNWRPQFSGRNGHRTRLWIALAVLTVILTIVVPSQIATSTQVKPKVILVSLDGMNPTTVKRFLREGVLRADRGLGLLRRVGIAAEQNVTVVPSLTAASHIAIGTGSTAARNDINANSFHLVASPFTSNISGFGAPIGGYTLNNSVASESADPTAEPLWLALRKQGKRVIAATFPGADGVDVKVPGVTNSPTIQSAQRRTVDFTVPFGAFGGIGAQGFSLTQADFTAAPATIVSQLQAAGKVSYSPVQQRVTPETVTVGGVTYTIQAAAIDTTNDNTVNYDTLVFYDVAQGIKPGPFSLPATGPAYVKAADRKSRRFYLEGSATKAGTSFYVSQLAPNLSTVRFARYSANFIPSTPAVQADVDAINTSVGFWVPQPDFRIPQRSSPGFTAFPDLELEAIYEDQVKTFVSYQTRVSLEALKRNPNADLALFYIEQPDGSGHQFSLTDPRQASDPTDPNSIGEGQDLDKVDRYQQYVKFSYQVADRAVQRLIEAVGTDRRGRPKSNIIVVSDHGMSPFHTAVNLNAYLTSKGFAATKVRAVTSGPAVNIYINLQGREPNGTVPPAEYLTLKAQVATALQELRDTNPNYVLSPTPTGLAVFAQVATRPDSPLGLATSEVIGQDAGDVFAVLAPGYNFDGTQTPVVFRKGDGATAAAPVFSVPSFYGAHGYDPALKQMSAVFYAAGPDIGQGKLAKVRNIDVAPTVLKLLGVNPSAKVQGRAVDLTP
jgi:predicted AlkP superfamily pyrophosphatase or phosphodiesterase